MTTYQRILASAIAIIRDRGVRRLTLDEVAHVARLSKGCLLYHFNTKEVLVQGMLDKMMDQWEAVLRLHWERAAPGHHRAVRALLSSSLDPASYCNDPVSGALVAALAINPALITPVRKRCREILAWVQEGSDPDLVTLIMLAVDGLCLQQVIGLELHDHEARRRLIAKALALLDASSPLDEGNPGDRPPPSSA